jgi:hypothetical protein
MQNGKKVLNELDFEKRIQEMEDRDLLEFVARQSYDANISCAQFEQRIAEIETGNRKSSTVAGSVAGTATSVIVGLISYFTNRV